MQKYFHRGDLGCGSTIGPTTAARARFFAMMGATLSDDWAEIGDLNMGASLTFGFPFVNPRRATVLHSGQQAVVLPPASQDQRMTLIAGAFHERVFRMNCACQDR